MLRYMFRKKTACFPKQAGEWIKFGSFRIRRHGIKKAEQTDN
jgi:hypothetical protein